MKNSQATCYVWDESKSNRGANEIRSNIFNYLLNLPSEITHVILYSNSCPGKNKYSIFLAMCMFLLQHSSSIQILEHKFLVPGHTRMEYDLDHAQIEKKKHFDTPIYHPHDWAQLIRMTGSKKPFEVIEMEREDFKDFGYLYKSKVLVMTKQNENGDRIVWKSIKWFKFEKKNPYKVYYKNTLSDNEDFNVNMRKSTTNTMSIKDIIIPICNENPPNISVEKKNDILSLFKYISSIYHNYYKDLPTEKKVNDPILSDNEQEEEYNIIYCKCYFSKVIL